jgi:putative component of membrane protein insertase Oxa1/YidC/SpoIIIJ protein YidD
MEVKAGLRRWRFQIVLGAVLAFPAISGLPVRAELAAIRLYQRTHTEIPLPQPICHFEQSCSNYGVGVLEADGFYLGNGRLLFRLGMCSPVGLLVKAVVLGLEN